MEEHTFLFFFVHYKQQSLSFDHSLVFLVEYMLLQHQRMIIKQKGTIIMTIAIFTSLPVSRTMDNSNSIREQIYLSV